MARTKVKLNSKGMASLLNDAGIRRDLTARAERVATTARSAAPVESGAYRASIQVVQDTTDRVAVRVAAGVDYSLELEAGTGNLAKALDSAGGS